MEFDAGVDRSLGRVKYGRDAELEELADKLLYDGLAGDNKRSLTRDRERMAYDLGLTSPGDLQHFDPTNDWDTLDSAFTLYIDPSDIAYLEPSICAGVDDGNDRARNKLMLERQAGMRHVGDGDEWGAGEEDIPLLGVNEGPRKTCTKCKRSKGHQYFSPKRDAKDKLHPWCKECRKNAVSQNRRNSRSE